MDNDTNKLIENLSIIASDPALKSSSRLLILIILYINKKMSFTDLLHSTMMGKGSLSNHIDKMKEEGLITTKNVFRLSGPGIMIEITGKGENIYQNYIDIINKLSSNGSEKIIKKSDDKSPFKL
ncbi:MarR family winged helix-turn-helix transcriptional regulator [Ferroplasma sp.]|uniref:MarR family winged helix-turn-helix transcriptional regulator n=1 Tax=Ferroplasma sp. TaxID=2591003 RepID=UPI00307EB215